MQISFKFFKYSGHIQNLDCTPKFCTDEKDLREKDLFRRFCYSECCGFSCDKTAHIIQVQVENVGGHFDSCKESLIIILIVIQVTPENVSRLKLY